MKIGMAGTAGWARRSRSALRGSGTKLKVWNRTAGKARGLGLEVAGSATRLADVLKTLISILTDAAAVESVYKQLLAGDVKGSCSSR